MADQLQQIVAFCSRRYNENRATRPDLAKAHLVIINRANDVILSTYDFGDLLDFLSKAHSDPDLVKACKEVLEHGGAEPGG
jgi:hypothetical protein